MGTNYYIDTGVEPNDDYSNVPHIGKTFNRSFIFYISRDHQMTILSAMDPESFVLNEYGERISVKNFLEKFSDCPFFEETSIFF